MEFSMDVNENEIKFAQLLANEYDNIEDKKKIFTTSVGISAFIKYLDDCALHVNSNSSLYRIPKIYKISDIADVTYAGATIDVRTYTNSDCLYVPKKHFEQQLIPKCYVFTLYNPEKNEITFKGYIHSLNILNIDTSKCTDDYYVVDNEKLLPMEDLVQELYSLPTFMHYCDHEAFSEVWISFMEDELDKECEIRIIKALYDCEECRTSFLEFNQFEFMAQNVEQYDDLFDLPEEVIQEIEQKKIAREKSVGADIIATTAGTVAAATVAGALGTGIGQKIEHGLEKVSDGVMEALGFLFGDNENDNNSYSDNNDKNEQNPDVLSQQDEQIDESVEAEDMTVVQDVVLAEQIADVKIDEPADIVTNTQFEEPELPEFELEEISEEVLEQTDVNVDEQVSLPQEIVDDDVAVTNEDLEEIQVANDQIEAPTELDELLVDEEELVETQEEVVEASTEEPTEKAILEQNVVEDDADDITSDTNEFDLLQSENESETETLDELTENDLNLNSDESDSSDLITEQQEEDLIIDNEEPDELKEETVETLDETTQLDELLVDEEPQKPQEEVEKVSEDPTELDELLVGEEETIETKKETVDETTNLDELLEDEEEPVELQEEIDEQQTEEKITELVTGKDNELEDKIETDEAVKESEQEQELIEQVEDTTNAEETLEETELLQEKEETLQTSELEETVSETEPIQVVENETLSPADIAVKELSQQSNYEELTEMLKELQSDDETTKIANENIPTLFETRAKAENLSKEDSLSEKEYEMYIDAPKQKSVNKKILVPLLSVCVLSVCIGGGIYKFSPKFNADKQNISNEQFRSIDEFDDKTFLEKTSTTNTMDTVTDELIPNPDAISANDMNQSMSNIFDENIYPVMISKIAWEVPESYTQSPNFKKYLQVTGVQLQRELQANLANVQETPENEEIIISFRINADNVVKNLKVEQTSGSAEIDKLTTDSLQNILTYIKVPVIPNNSNHVDLTIVINF